MFNRCKRQKQFSKELWLIDVEAWAAKWLPDEKPETIDIGDKTYEVSDDLKAVLKKLKEV